jgi:hypothetical protein
MKKWSGLLNRSKQEIGRKLDIFGPMLLVPPLALSPFLPGFSSFSSLFFRPRAKKGVTHPRTFDVSGGRFDPR